MTVAIEPGFTTAAANFNATPTVPLQQIAMQYKGIQLMENWAANQATVRSLLDQLAAAQVVSEQLVALALKAAPRAPTPYLSADNAAAVAWQNGRQSTIEESVNSQVAAILGGFPAPFNV